MARPKKCRWVEFEPGITFFKPQGIPLRNLEQMVISVDELEALRLSDYLGLSHEEVAKEMNVSRPTVTRMLARAHRAVADALVNGKAIKIQGGDYKLAEREYRCNSCSHIWSGSPGISSPEFCPECQGSDIQRSLP
jgi:predicted DNA-binding protein (UPF0251 family)